MATRLISHKKRPGQQQSQRQEENKANTTVKAADQARADNLAFAADNLAPATRNLSAVRRRGQPRIHIGRLA